MRPRASAAVLRNELRLLRRDPVPLVIMVVMPLLLMAFLEPLFTIGPAQTVPGMTVLFAFFMVGNVGYTFFREHGWGTWDRLRASPASAAEVMVGKVAAPVVTYAVQLAILFGLGVVLFDLTVTGSLTALALVALALTAALVGLALLLVAVCRTVMQLQTLANLGAIVLAGTGGALVPSDLLPGWARAVSPATPGHWAMQGFHDVVSGGAGIADVSVPVGVLSLFTLAFGGLAAARFRFDEAKAAWA
jgi:ABC-2 type transport system permease protein